MSATLLSQEDPYAVPSKLFHKVTQLQRVSAGLAILSATIALGLTIKYCKDENMDEGFLGGLNWGKLIFNWHPILMVAGLIFCSVSAIVSYRLLPFTKLITKSIHGLLHLAGVICLCVGFSAVYIGNNNPDKNYATTGYYSNFTSIHSILGLIAIMLYGQNFLCGVFHYLSPMASLELRKFYMPSHMFFGMFSLFAACMAACAGIMELEFEYGCSYDPTSPDTNPAANYHILKKGCQVLNGMGICIFLTAFFAAFALWEINAPVKRDANGHLIAERGDKLLEEEFMLNT